MDSHPFDITIILRIASKFAKDPVMSTMMLIWKLKVKVEEAILSEGPKRLL